MELVGIEKIDYVNKNNVRITGNRLHFVYEDKKVQGCATEIIFVGSGVDVASLEIGKQYTILYNKFGKVANITSI